MPATSQAQQRFFGWLKANPAEAQRRGISAKVADEFAHAPGGTTKGLPARAKQPGARGGPAFKYNAAEKLPVIPRKWHVGGDRPETDAPWEVAHPGKLHGNRPPQYAARMPGKPSMGKIRHMVPLMIIRIAHGPKRSKQVGARGPDDTTGKYDFMRLVL